MRYGLARIKHFYLHYHSPDEVARIMGTNGFREHQRIAGHSFTVMAFERS
jgi:hypothetical protein